MTDLHSETKRESLLAVVCDVFAALNPVSLWQALGEADEGVCLMVPVRVRSNDRRRR